MYFVRLRPAPGDCRPSECSVGPFPSRDAAHAWASALQRDTDYTVERAYSPDEGAATFS